MLKRAKVAIIMGSDSDLPTMGEAVKILGEYGVAHDVKILSAHRSPDDTVRFAKDARSNGFSVIIAGAGGAAHLAGVVASHTTLPVIGVPLDSGAGLGGMDALLSTVQMPPGVPVATMAVGKAGAKNAAIFAVQILALSDKNLQEKLTAFKQEQKKKVIQTDAELQ